MVIQKARSRLYAPVDLKSPELNRFSRLRQTKSLPIFSLPTKLVSEKTRAIIQPWLEHWPQLLIGCSVLFALWHLLNSYPPSQLAHIVWPNSYLPVISLWFIGWWYLAGFLLRSSRRGLLFSLISATWLASRLQFILTPWWLWPAVLITWLASEITWRKLRKPRV